MGCFCGLSEEKVIAFVPDGKECFKSMVENNEILSLEFIVPGDRKQIIYFPIGTIFKELK